MADKIDWGSIPGLTAKVIKELAKLPFAIAVKAYTALEEGSAASITAEQVRAYRDTDQGDASALSVQSKAEGRVRPTTRETFAGRPADFARDDPSNKSGTFGAGFTPIETERSIGSAPEIATAQQKSVPNYTKSTALKDNEGNQLTVESFSGLDDADITERYTVFFGEKPKNIKAARSELVDLLKSFSTTANPLLD